MAVMVNELDTVREHMLFVNDHEHSRAMVTTRAARASFLTTVEQHRQMGLAPRVTFALYALKSEGHYELLERRTAGG
jgi:hypothetical protein